MSIRAHYFNAPNRTKGHNNFGDMLVPIIIKWLSGQDTVYVNNKFCGKLLCIGSELASGRHLQPNDVVWGYGAKYDRPIYVPAGVKIFSVRGKFTKSLIKNYDVPDVYGDPAILLPLIYTPQTTKQFEVGVIPHYIDKPLFNLKQHKLINIQDNPYKVIDELNTCEVIVATSLHGAIVAESYGISTVWLHASNKVGGMHTKWNDYFSGTGRESQTPININKPITDRIINKIKTRILPPQQADRDLLIKAWKDNEQYILRTCKGS